MEAIPALLAIARELGPPALWALLFVAGLFLAQRALGDWFALARAGVAGSAEAQGRVNTSMLALIEKLNGEIKRLSDSERAIMERLEQCEKRHRQRDIEVEKLQGQISMMHVKLFTAGLSDKPT